MYKLWNIVNPKRNVLFLFGIVQTFKCGAPQKKNSNHNFNVYLSLCVYDVLMPMAKFFWLVLNITITALNKKRKKNIVSFLLLFSSNYKIDRAYLCQWYETQILIYFRLLVFCILVLSLVLSLSLFIFCLKHSRGNCLFDKWFPVIIPILLIVWHS